MIGFQNAGFLLTHADWSADTPAPAARPAPPRPAGRRAVQKTKMDIITVGAAVDAEKDFCLERFMAGPYHARQIPFFSASHKHLRVMEVLEPRWSPPWVNSGMCPQVNSGMCPHFGLFVRVACFVDCRLVGSLEAWQ